MPYLIIYGVVAFLVYVIVFAKSRDIEKFFREHQRLSTENAHKAAQFTTVIFAFGWPFFAVYFAFGWCRNRWKRYRVNAGIRRIEGDLRRYLLGKSEPPLIRSMPGCDLSAVPTELLDRNSRHQSRVYSFLAAWLYQRLAGIPDDTACTPAADSRIWKSAVDFAIGVGKTLRFFRPPVPASRDPLASPQPIEIHDVHWTATREPFRSMADDNREDAVRAMVVWVNDRLNEEAET